VHCSGIVIVNRSDDSKPFSVVDEPRLRWSRRRWLERLGIDLKPDAIPSALAIRKNELDRDSHDEPDHDHKDGYGHAKL